MKNTFGNLTVIICFALVFIVAGCGGDDASTPRPTVDPGEDFAETAVASWLGFDFSNSSPDGASDSDGDGNLDTDDAVNFVQTFREMGYSLSETTTHGLYNNYFTEAGYGYPDDGSLPETPFSFTRNSSVSQSDLQAADWSGLHVGDLIFVDHDKDNIWDSAAVYLGAHGEFSHAVLQASDYYDEVVILDLEYSNEMIRQDIQYGFSDVRTPDYDNIAGN